MKYVREHLFEILVICLSALTPLLWLHDDSVILGHDSGFRLNYLEHLKNLFFSWHENSNFGIDWSLYHGFISIQSVETFFSLLFSSLAIGERLTFVFWFFLIGVSMLIFVKYFFGEKQFFLLFVLGPVFYMYNFYLLQAWTIAERAKFSLYIALPLMIVIFFKTIKKETSLINGGILFGLLFFIMNGGGSPPLYGGIFVTFILLMFFFFVSNPQAYAKRLLGVVCTFAILFVLFNAYWLLPQVRLFGGNYIGAVSSRGGIEGLIAWEREISKYASIPNILRFGGFPDWYDNPQHPYAAAYLVNPFLRAISFVPMIIVLIGFLLYRAIRKKDRQILFFLIILAAVGLFFTAGSHAPFGGIYTYLMRHVSGFAIFRSSFYKFAPTVYLPFIIFFGYFLSLFFDRFLKKFIDIRFLGLIMSVILILYHYPYLTGNFFGIKDGFSTKVFVPKYVNDIATYVEKNTDSSSRILLVPPLDTGYINSPIDTYNWGYYSLDALPRIIANRSFLANDSNDDSITRLLYESLMTHKEASFLALAAKAGVTHILWRGDVRLSANREKLMPLSLWKAAADTFQSVSGVYEAGPWKLFAIKEPTSQMVNVSENIVLVQEGASDDAYVITRTNDNKATIQVTADSQTMLTPIADAYYSEAECFFCKPNEYSKLVESITLPQIRKNPFGLLTWWQSQKEVKALALAAGKPAEIDVLLSTATARLAENGKTSDYREYINRSLEIVKSLSGRERDYYANRIMAYLDAYMRESNGKASEVVIENAREKVRPLEWRADTAVFRFGITIPNEAEYRLWVPVPGAYSTRLEIDGRVFDISAPLKITAGYHRLSLTPLAAANTVDRIPMPVFLYRTLRTAQKVVPAISVVKKDPTRYDVSIQNSRSPFVLVFNQRFDPGWGISKDGIRQGYFHQTANGFANSWVIPETGTYDLSLYYIPQQVFYGGSIITIVSLLGAAGYLTAISIKKKIL